MSGYSKTIVTTIDFDGNTVVVTMSPLKFVDMLKIDGPLINTVNASKDLKVETDKVERLAILEKIDECSRTLIELAFDVLPRYIVGLSGLFDSSGRAMEIHELFESAYFTELLSKLLVELRNRSVPQDPPSPDARSSA